MVDAARTGAGVGSTSNMSWGIGMNSSSSSLLSLSLSLLLLLSLSLARHAYALETIAGFDFAVGFTLIGLTFVAMAVDTSTGGGVGSKSNISWRIGTISSSSSGALVDCCGWYAVILTESLSAGGAVPS